MHKIIDHTADIGLIVKSDSIVHTLEELAIAMFELMVNIEKVEMKITQYVTVTYTNMQFLVIDFLTELLVLFETDQFIPKIVKIHLDPNMLNAELVGEQYDREKHGAKYEIKAITYHMLSVDLEKNEISVLFDI